MRGALWRIADQILQSQIAGTERVGDASIVKSSYPRALRDYALLGVWIGGLEMQTQTPITYGDLNTRDWTAR